MTIEGQTRCRNSPLGSKLHQLVSWLLLITILNMMVMLMVMMMMMMMRMRMRRRRRKRCQIKMMMLKVFPMMMLIMLMLLLLMILKAKLLCHHINCHKFGKLCMLSIIALVQLFFAQFCQITPPVWSYKLLII